MEINNSYTIRQGNGNTNSKNNLSVNDFLQIMAAEIKNQLPLGDDSGGGGSKTDYITQLAQFTQLEQIGSISDSLNTLTLMGVQQYSFSLIGKEVTVYGDEGNVSGIVEKVKFNNGHAVLIVDGKEYYLNSVLEVANT